MQSQPSSSPSAVVDVDGNNNLPQWAKERAEYIWNEGIKYVGVSKEINPDQPPAWFDPELFKRAQDLWSSYKVM